MKTTSILAIAITAMLAGSAIAGEAAAPVAPVSPVMPALPLESIIPTLDLTSPLAMEPEPLASEPGMPNGQVPVSPDWPAPDASFPPAPDATVPPPANPPAQPAQPAPPAQPVPQPPPNPVPQPVSEPTPPVQPTPAAPTAPAPAPTAPALPPAVIQPQPAQPPVAPLEAQRPAPAGPPQPPAVAPVQAPPPIVPQPPAAPAVPQNPPPAPVQPGAAPAPDVVQNPPPANAPGEAAPPAPAPPAAPVPVKSITILGFVQAAKVKSGVQSVKFITNDAEYVVVMDQRGLDLGKKMANNRVEITGIITDDKDRKLLTIQSFRPQLMGTVDSAISANGSLMLARLLTAGGVYVIVLDDKGVEIGSTMHGRKVNVIGTVINEKSRTRELLVKSWEEFREIQPFSSPDKPAAQGQVSQ